MGGGHLNPTFLSPKGKMYIKQVKDFLIFLSSSECDSLTLSPGVTGHHHGSILSCIGSVSLWGHWPYQGPGEGRDVAAKSLGMVWFRFWLRDTRKPGFWQKVLFIGGQSGDMDLAACPQVHPVYIRLYFN